MHFHGFYCIDIESFAFLYNHNYSYAYMYNLWPGVLYAASPHFSCLHNYVLHH